LSGRRWANPVKIGALLIDESALAESFVRASGPGGQNVNKVSSAVELRFDARRAGLPDDVAARLARLAGSRMTSDGVVVIFAQRFSSQPRNREDARERLAALLLKAQEAPRPRRATRPTLASKTRRLEAKGRRGAVKVLRQDVSDPD
jgi:ribosome-associated protein